MEDSFDLDINNYTSSDLIKFFKLNESYTINDLVKKTEELTRDIFSPKTSSYNAKYKNDILHFITQAKEALILFKKELGSIGDINKTVNKFMNKTDTTTGKIINPLAAHPALETMSIPPENINGYGSVVNTSIYVFNTATRNDYFATEPSSATFVLPIKWKNVISLSLSSANIPNVMYTFNEQSQTNQLYIEEDGTGMSAVVILPEGNYSPYNIPLMTESSFAAELTKVINEQVINEFNSAYYRFKVEISLTTRQTIISNNTNTFTMNVLRKVPPTNCNGSKYASNTNIEYNEPSPPSKTKIPLVTYLQTMGHLMGFRETYYTGQKSYTSESVFSNTYSEYLFFELYDYTGSQPTSSTYGLIGKEILKGDILGVIPISSSLFATTFDNNSNFIYKKREYFGPVDISRLTVKLLNQKGNTVNLRETDYSFSIEVRSIYNINNNSKDLKSGGIF